ncbi:MAG: alginate export family protein [Bacteroidetes bacterium]|nr:alginate export family protein [Bacteroidota bacterium]
MKKFTLLFLLFSLVFTDITFAQDKLKINAQIRPRFQYDNKDFNSNTGTNTFTELRSRLGVLFSSTEDLTGFFQIQDSRRFGSESSTLANSANLDLHQAYFSISNFFELPLNLKVGRMELSYGSQRLIGPVGWSNVGRSFDGSVLKLITKSVDVDFIVARTNESGFADDSLDMFLYSAYGNLKGFDNLKIQPFIIGERRAKVNFNRYTIGLFMSSKKKGKGFYNELDAAYQLGTQNTTQDISAFMAAYNFSYTFSSKVKPKLGAGIAFLSGDDGKDASKFKVFNTLYATNHKFYGYMDYFLNIPANTFGLGLLDIHAKASIVPFQKSIVSAAYHLFKSNEDYTLLNGNTSSSFGSEVDLTLSYKYSKEVKFVGGLSFFVPGDIFKEKKGKDTSTWAYLMAVVNL